MSLLNSIPAFLRVAKCFLISATAALSVISFDCPPSITARYPRLVFMMWCLLTTAFLLRRPDYSKHFFSQGEVVSALKLQSSRDSTSLCAFVVSEKLVNFEFPTSKAALEPKALTK